MLEPCHGCGWRVEGGYSGCRARFDEILARDFSDARYFASHRLMVDTYCLQHPDESCASAKSLAGHLVGLCWILEHEAQSSVGPKALQRWLNGNRQLSKPPIPSERGRLTIGDLSLEDDPKAWAEAVMRWAETTWKAYESLHPVAREWLEIARHH